MSEKRAFYDSGNEIASLDAFRNRPCALPFCSGDYRPPTPFEVESLIKLAGWSQREVALIAGVRHDDKGSTAVRRWKTKDGKESRAIPYAAWRQLLEVAGIVTVDEVREELVLNRR